MLVSTQTSLNPLRIFFFFFCPTSWNSMLYLCTLVVSHNLKESFITFLELFLNATLSSLILCTISGHLSPFELWYLSSQVSGAAVLRLCFQTPRAWGIQNQLLPIPIPQGSQSCAVYCALSKDSCLLYFFQDF